MDQGTTMNGAAQTSELAVVRDGGLWLIGQMYRSPFGNKLEPAFELVCQAHQDPAGGVRVVYGAQPLLLIGALSTWELSLSAQWWKVADLGTGIADTLKGAVARGQQMVQSMRAAQAGLTIARDMPRGRQ